MRPVTVESSNRGETGVVPTTADKVGWKVIGGVGTILAGNAARNALEGTYKKATGRIPPHNPEDPDVDWKEAITWAIVSGVVMAIARLLFQRAAAGAWVKHRGELPPGLERDEQQLPEKE
jgi:hypothetical protein